MRILLNIVLACMFKRGATVWCKPTSGNSKYTLHKLHENSTTFATGTSRGGPKDKIATYKDFIAELYSRQMATVSEEGIPRTFYETKNCGNVHDPKNFGSKIISAWDEAKRLDIAQKTARNDFDFGKVHKHWLGSDWDGSTTTKRSLPVRTLRIYPRTNNMTFSDERIQPQISIIFGSFSDTGALHHMSIYTGTVTITATNASSQVPWHIRGPDYELDGEIIIMHSVRSLRVWTLDDAIRNAESSYHRQQIMEDFQTNRGQVMLHEIYHSTVVSNPRTGDYAYRADASRNLSRDGGTWYAFENADSYTLDAMAIYVQQHFSQSEPLVPQRYYKDTAEAIDIDLPSAPVNPGASQQPLFADTPPGWSGAPVVELNPDPSFWTEFVREGLPPLGPDLNVAGEVFGSTGTPPEPLSALRITTVPTPPLLATKTVESSQPLSTVPSKPIPEPSRGTSGIEFPQPLAASSINILCHAKTFYHSLIIPPIAFGTGTSDDGRSRILGVTDAVLAW